MVVDGVIQPLLAVGQSVTALIDHDRSGGRQIVEQAGGLAPGQSHQASQPLRRASLQQFFCGFIPQQAIQSFRHGLPQLIGHEGAKARGGELQAVHRVQ